MIEEEEEVPTILESEVEKAIKKLKKWEGSGAGYNKQYNIKGNKRGVHPVPNKTLQLHTSAALKSVGYRGNLSATQERK